MRHIHLLLSLSLLLACGEDPKDDTGPAGDTAPPELSFVTGAWEDGGAIPVLYSCDGDDLSPPLAWSGLPGGTLSLAVVVVDPDANDCPHWAVFDLPPDLAGLDEGVSPGGDLPAGALELANFRGSQGYAGPCPPAEHEYLFTLYALDTDSVGLGEDASFDDLEAAAGDALLGSASFTGLYGG